MTLSDDDSTTSIVLVIIISTLSVRFPRLPAAYRRAYGSIHLLGPKVGSHLALFCIHRVRALSTRHAVRLPDPSASEHSALHGPVRPTHQPLQREDLSAHLVLAGLPRRGHVCQSPALDNKALHPLHSGMTTDYCKRCRAVNY